MKKTIIAAISIILMLFAFVACDGEPTKPSETEQLAEEVTSSVNDILKAIFTDAMKLETKNDVAWETEDYSGTYDFVVESKDNSWDLAVVGNKIEEEAAPETKANEATSHDIEFKLASEDVADKDSEINITIAGSDEPIKIKVSGAVKNVTFPMAEEEDEIEGFVLKASVLPQDYEIEYVDGTSEDFTAADLQGTDVVISATGEVKGTFRPVDAKNFGEKWGTGYYFLIKLNVEESEYPWMQIGEKVCNTDKYENDPANQDKRWSNELMLYLGKDAAEAQKKTITIKVAESEEGLKATDAPTLTLSFKDADFKGNFIKASVINQEEEIGYVDGSKEAFTVSAVQWSNVEIAQNGAVTGTFFKVTPEHFGESWGTGYYFLVKLDVEETAYPWMQIGEKVCNTDKYKNDPANQDKLWSNELMLYLGKDETEARNKSIEVIVAETEDGLKGSSPSITFTFENAAFNGTKAEVLPQNYEIEYTNGDKEEGLTVADFQGENINIAASGAVTGTIYQASPEKFGDDWGIGYYFLVKLNVEEVEYPWMKIGTKICNTEKYENDLANQDKLWSNELMLYLGESKEVAKAKTITVQIGETEQSLANFITFSFENATFDDSSI